MSKRKEIESTDEAEGLVPVQDDAGEVVPPIRAIRLDRAGAKRCGQFERGTVYRVPDDVTLEEAHRLVSVKGFKVVEG